METKHSSTPSARHLPSKVRFKFPFKHQNTFYEAETLLGRLLQRDTDLDKESRLGPGSTSSPPLRTLSSCDQAQKTSINAVITQKCRMFFISQDWLQHYCPPGEETMHGSWWATKTAAAFLSPEQRWRWRQSRLSHDVTPSWDEQQRRSGREALLSVWEQRCWEFIPAAALRAPEAACCCTSVVMSVCQTVLNRNYSQSRIFIFSPPQVSLRALQRLKTRQNAATWFWWVFHLLLFSVSNPSQKSRGPWQVLFSRVSPTYRLSAGTCATLCL